MSISLTVRDETAAGKSYHEFPLVLPSEEITIGELIRERVYQEVQDFNRQAEQDIFSGLVQPSDAERVLNGTAAQFRLKKRRQIDWKEQYEKAIDAFQKNAFLILVGDKQAESLDEVVTLHSTSQVAFVKLTMLVGG